MTQPITKEIKRKEECEKGMGKRGNKKFKERRYARKLVFNVLILF